MNTTPTIHEPEPPAPTAGRPPQMVWIQLTIQEVDWLVPPDNHIASIILAHHLESSIESAGVRASDLLGASGPLNQSFYCFEVTAVRPAVDAIKKTLGKLKFLPYAIIGWFDPRENIIRTLYPSEGGVMDNNKASERDARILSLLMEVMEQGTLSKLQTPPAFQPPPTLPPAPPAPPAATVVTPGAILLASVIYLLVTVGVVGFAFWLHFWLGIAAFILAALHFAGNLLLRGKRP